VASRQAGTVGCLEAGHGAARQDGHLAARWEAGCSDQCRSSSRASSAGRSSGKNSRAPSSVTRRVSAVDALRKGFIEWIRLASDPVVQRILLIDAPSVLGWQEWRAMEERHALGLIRSVLQEIADQGDLRPELVGTLAHVLLASVNEVALLVARADDQEAAMKNGADAIDELLRRLLS
jgi:hypothetical protein